MIERVRRGETEAYGELVRAHAPLAQRVALALGAGADAEDVVQIAFLKAYRSLGGFRDGAEFRPWLLRIVANETKNTVRAARRRRGLHERAAALEGFRLSAVAPAPGPRPAPGAGDEPAASGTGADPAAALLDAERREELLDALRRLREPQRLVVVHRYLLGLDEAETAAALGIPRGTVKSRLSRALRELERLLPHGEGGGGR
ncbi:RNA polymerase sigma factor [Streptomyces sp. NPDC051940]|uniref:RNA polymerase sigma factor n=1 Tax=Streptomyces sp. NPDC051940 TaxID=3155675 RepID=UPI003415F678